VVTDEMRVTIAALACLLILNRDTDYYPNLRQVLVYPGAFVVQMEESDEAGVVMSERHVLSGESWSQSQVILSWEDVLEGAAVADDGFNVVIHEFAHQLDQEAGYANGAPEMASRGHYARWSRILGEEYERLRARTEAGEPSLLDDYGATDPAEFFAVLAEVFFEQPQLLQAENGALYEELCRFFRVRPAEWTGPDARDRLAVVSTPR
jgi:Mlc titration factor MtfA (ptsG expression regulator)